MVKLCFPLASIIFPLLSFPEPRCSLPEAILELAQLRELVLYFNHLTALPDPTVPPRWTSLERLSVSQVPCEKKAFSA